MPVRLSWKIKQNLTICAQYFCLEVARSEGRIQGRMVHGSVQDWLQAKIQHESSRDINKRKLNILISHLFRPKPKVSRLSGGHCCLFEDNLKNFIAWVC